MGNTLVEQSAYLCDLIFMNMNTELFFSASLFQFQKFFSSHVEYIKKTIKRGDDILYFSYLTILQESINCLCQLLKQVSKMPSARLSGWLA